jgi:prepilin-type N-terminal cleavage/methylation domain-containing protein
MCDGFLVDACCDVHASKVKIMKIHGPGRAGFTLVEMMIVVAIIGLLTAIAIPNFVRARTQSQMNACINNLRQIDGAIQQFALEQKLDPTTTVNYSEISTFLKRNVTCPAGGIAFADSYTIIDCQTKPACQKVPSSHILP